MRLHKFVLLVCFCLVYFLFYSAKPKGDNLLKPTTNDYFNYIAINEIKMWVANNGDGSHDPYTDGNGFYWPGGEKAENAGIFEDGLLWGGVVNGEIRANGNTHRQGLQAGKILSPGNADNPDDPKYRVYKIRKNWETVPQGPERDALGRDYNEWPVEDGAPWIDIDGDNIYTSGVDEPEFVGDEVLWYVSNDLDTSRSRRTYGSDPIGLEIQTLVYGYNEVNFLKDVVFKKYTLINKSEAAIDDMYLSYWTDDDLGDAQDDFVGCDTLLNLSFAYNGDNEDSDGRNITYGTPPPAVGHMLIRGPVVPGELSDSARYQGQWLPGYKNLPLTFFYIITKSDVFTDPTQGAYIGTLELYGMMKNLIWNGNPVTDPHTGLVVDFCVPGDPVIGEGWYEGAGWPSGYSSGDRRYIMTTGPISMAPGDTQQVEIAIFMAIGDDHIDSITELRKTALEIHQFAGNQISNYWLAGDFQCTLEKHFMRAQTDSMRLQVTFQNPNTHNYLTTAIIKSVDDTYQDSLLLYDDGNHHDQNAGDGIWGTMIRPIDVEKEFTVSMSAIDPDSLIHYKSGELARFITIGPVSVDHYEISSSDTIPNPGDKIAFQLTLKNEGLMTGVSNITTHLVALDECATPADLAFYPEYGNIDPGQLVKGSHGQSINFSTACGDSFWTSLKVEIYTDNKLWWTDTISVFVHRDPSDVGNDEPGTPTKYALKQNYPNPFNPRTIINYELRMTNEVDLSIYNLLGQKVATLVSERKNAGYYQVEWDASDFPSGIYYYKISAGEFQAIRKMILLR